jgi:hypothetical protein
MSAAIVWVKGGQATVVRAEDDRATLRSTISSAPGSRLDGKLPSGADVRVKVHRCVRTESGFELEGRLLDAKREVRREIEALARRPEE